jgi:hypothetical protein
MKTLKKIVDQKIESAQTIQELNRINMWYNIGYAIWIAWFIISACIGPIPVCIATQGSFLWVTIICILPWVIAAILLYPVWTGAGWRIDQRKKEIEKLTKN